MGGGGVEKNKQGFIMKPAEHKIRIITVMFLHGLIGFCKIPAVIHRFMILLNLQNQCWLFLISE